MTEERRAYTEKIMIEGYYALLNLLLERLKDKTITGEEIEVLFEILSTGKLDEETVQDAT